MSDTYFSRSGSSPGVTTKSNRHRRQLQRQYEAARNTMLDAFYARDCGVLIPRSDPIATAVHEAAHCVFYEAFGITVGRATCVPDFSKGKLGNVQSNAHLVPLPGILHVIADLAGDLAERPFITHALFSAETACISDTDLHNLMRFLQESGFKESEYVEVYLALAGDCLTLIGQSQHWIEAVAVLLYASKTAQGDSVRKVLRAKDFYSPDNPLVMFKAYVNAKVSQHQVCSPAVEIPADVVEGAVAA